MTDRVEIGRLAMRVEGENWNAYWAPEQTTMERAVYLGSIKMLFVERKDRKAAFMALMQDCFADVVEQKFNIRPSWKGPVAALLHERSGEA